MSYLLPPPDPAPVVVMKDVGGFVSQYHEQTELYRASDREVRLHECRSACTLALSLPNVCVYPTSILKFHKAYDQRTKVADEWVSYQMMMSYPPAVREKLGTLTRKYRVLTGSELIRLGVRDCNTPRPPQILLARARPQPVEGTSVSSVVGSLMAALGGKSEWSPVSGRRMRVVTARAEAKPFAVPPENASNAANPAANAPDAAAAPPEGLVEPPAPPRRPEIFAQAPLRAAPTSLWGRPIPGSASILLAARFTPFAYRQVARDE